MHPFCIETYAPAPDLARLVAFHQSINTNAGWRETFVPAPHLSFIFRFDDGAAPVADAGAPRLLPRHLVATPGCTPVAIRAAGRVDAFRVALHPHTVECILQTAASNVRDRVLDMADCFGREGEALIRRMAGARDARARIDVFEQWLRLRMRKAKPVHDMDYAVRRLAQGGDACRVGDIASALGIGARQLERRFLRSVGMGPKLFQRVARVNAVLRDARQREADWASLAVQHGFSDQSHLVREFVALAGETPAACLRSAGVLRAAFQAQAPRTSAAFPAPAVRAYPRTVPAAV